ncbi:hypothetical protein KEJ37_01055 [Candidatus Bathyarchaeota archaeon]|nr:hypothetical protein [Candidatus Bathyarchaeota archaeon]
MKWARQAIGSVGAAEAVKMLLGFGIENIVAGARLTDCLIGTVEALDFGGSNSGGTRIPLWYSQF